MRRAWRLLGRGLSMRRWIWSFAPMSMPCVGSSSNSSFGESQRLAEHDFLLIASTERADRRLGAGGLDRQPVDPVLGLVDLCLRRRRPPRKWAADVADREVLADVHRSDRASDAALGGDESEAGVDGLPWLIVGDRCAVERHLAVVAWDLAGDQGEHVLSARAGDTGEADDLPRRDIEVDALDRAAAQAAKASTADRHGMSDARRRSRCEWPTISSTSPTWSSRRRARCRPSVRRGAR